MRVKRLASAVLHPIATARSIAKRVSSPERSPDPAMRPSILLNTMPKSGSVYVFRSLCAILNRPHMYIGHGYAFIDQISPQNAEILSKGGFVSQNHFAPSPENLQLLRHFHLKMVLHLRDPRQALLSWVHHLDWITGRNDDSIWLLYFEPRTPPGYFDFSFHEKIDWQIEHFLPQLVRWTGRWLEIADQGMIPMLITHQEELRTNERAFFQKILAFCDLETDYAPVNLPRTMDATHYRSADPTEWARIFTPAQIAEATAVLPTAMAARFGWHHQPRPRMQSVR